MKNKHFIIFSILVLICVMCAVLVACSHKHKWNDNWLSDENYHYHTCQKKGCEEASEKSQHTFVYTSDANAHWEKCSVCGYEKGKTEHSFKFVVDSDESKHCGKCEICGYEQTAVAHTYKSAYDDVYHFDKCDVCGHVINEEKHKFFNDKCDVLGCGYVRGTKELIYELNSDGQSYAVKGFTFGTTILDTDVVIGEYYNRKPVTTIGAEAFQDLDTITSIVIPKTITKIEKRAFRGCYSLLEITIPQSVVAIEERVFEDCFGITIKVEATQASSGWETSDWQINQFSKFPVVYDCKNNNIADDGYEYVIYQKENSDRKIKYGLKNGEAMIAKQSKNEEFFNFETSVEFEKKKYKVTSIVDYAFYQNSYIDSINIPIYVKKIGNYAFAECDSLLEINWMAERLPEEVEGTGVRELGVCAFKGCSSILEFTLPSKVTSIQGGLLQDCTKLKEILISTNINHIGDSAFVGCSQLVIRCEVASKPSGWSDKWNESNRPVIWDCNNNDTSQDGYRFVEIGANMYGIRDIDMSAILITSKQISSSEIYIPATITSSGLNYTVTIIGENAFANHTELSIVRMSNNIESIQSGAFANCYMLETIEFNGSVEEWNTISKGDKWDYMTGDYIVKCNNNAVLDKWGNIISK